MDRSPRPPTEGVIRRSMLTRAWVFLGFIEAALVLGGFFYVLLDSNWSPGADVSSGSPLHDTYIRATTMTFAGIVACQIGTALAARTERASLRSVGFFSNRFLLWAILSEIPFLVALIYLPPLQAVFGTASLDPVELAILAAFPVGGLGRGRDSPGTPEAQFDSCRNREGLGLHPGLQAAKSN